MCAQCCINFIEGLMYAWKGFLSIITSMISLISLRIIRSTVRACVSVTKSRRAVFGCKKRFSFFSSIEIQERFKSNFPYGVGVKANKFKYLQFTFIVCPIKILEWIFFWDNMIVRNYESVFRSIFSNIKHITYRNMLNWKPFFSVFL